MCRHLAPPRPLWVQALTEPTNGELEPLQPEVGAVRSQYIQAQELSKSQHLKMSSMKMTHRFNSLDHLLFPQYPKEPSTFHSSMHFTAPSVSLATTSHCSN